MLDWKRGESYFCGENTPTAVVSLLNMRISGWLGGYQHVWTCVYVCVCALQPQLSEKGTWPLLIETVVGIYQLSVSAIIRHYHHHSRPLKTVFRKELKITEPK